MLSDKVKREIVQMNIAKMEQLIYDASIQKRAAEIVGEQKPIEAAMKNMDTLNRKLNAFEKILAELPNDETAKTDE